MLDGMDTKIFQQLGRIAQKYPQIPWELLRGINFDGPLPVKRPELGPCWLWTKANVHGYGNFSQTKGGKGKSVSTYLTHRIVYALTIGKIPEGLVLDHLCERRPCCNPCHLEPVTHNENIRRSFVGKKLWLKEICKNGHELKGENLIIAADGARRCQACATIRFKKWRDENHAARSEWEKAYYQANKAKILARTVACNRARAQRKKATELT